MKNAEAGNGNQQQNQESRPNSEGTGQKSPKHQKREPKRQNRQGQEGNSQSGHHQQQREAQQPPQTPPQQRQRWRQGQERQQQNRQTNNQQVETQRWHGIGGGGGGGGNGGPRGNRQYFNNQNQQQQRQRWQQRGRGFISGRGTKAKERIDHAGVKMTGQVSDCSICYQQSDLFGLGDCMHPICMECALRIRVFGESRQCPHCRAEIPRLNFVSAPPGQQLLLRLPNQTIDQPEHQRKFGVLFESQYALDCFNAYMANRCIECGKRGKQTEFGAFAELRAHLAQAHELSFCHICCDNLNVLIKDRRVYSRDELQQHMNGKLAGEQEGFRGHPTCQFCEERFYDDEQQYRHLRKEHYYCQFCDQDGREQNVFYRNQFQLNKHNSRCHHPCADPECLQMGICFRTDVELDVHKAKQHHRWLYQSGGGNGAGPSRSGTIPLDIQFTHSRGGQKRQPNEIDENLAANSESEQQNRQQSTQIVRIVPSAQSQQQTVQIVRPPSLLANSINSNADFPSLPAPPPPPTIQQYGAPPGWIDHQSNHLQIRPNQPNPISNRPSIPSLNSRDQFPSLGGGGGQSSKVLGQQNNTIWGQKSTKELFAPRPAGAESSKKLEESKRPKFIPSPECWPEHMLEKLKAREEGKPDPDPIQPPNWLNPPKKEKKRKTKTVPLASAANRLAAAEMALDLVPSSSASKFNTLAAYDEMDESTSAGKASTNWWSGGHQPPSTRAQLKLTPSKDDPDFVRIQLPGDQRKQRIEQQKTQIVGEGEEKNSTLSIGPPPGFEFEALQKGRQNDESEENDWEAQNEEDALKGKAEKSSSPIDLPSSPDPPAAGPSNSGGGGGGIVHLTMRSIASAIFGGGGGGENDDKKE